METVPAIQLSDLPQSVQQLVEIIGIKETVLIMDDSGGRGVYFSKNGKHFERWDSKKGDFTRDEKKGKADWPEWPLSVGNKE